jgi:hypothetical protein
VVCRFQLAYYRLYGELRCTYETVMTKMFDHGRTEAQRCCTKEVGDVAGAVTYRRMICVNDCTGIRLCQSVLR